MPTPGALACTQRLKEKVATRGIPIIMLGTSDRPDDMEAALEAGADQYVARPFPHREFILRVRSMARLRRAKAELVARNDAHPAEALLSPVR